MNFDLFSHYLYSEEITKKIPIRKKKRMIKSHETYMLFHTLDTSFFKNKKTLIPFLVGSKAFQQSSHNDPNFPSNFQEAILQGCTFPLH